MVSPRLGGDRGAGALLVLTGVAVVLAAVCVALTWAGAVAARQQAEGAADLAALAGARAVLTGGDGCAAAGRVAWAGGAWLAGCRVGAGADVTVAVEVHPGWLRRLDMPPARARARAGGFLRDRSPSGAGDQSGG